MFYLFFFILSLFILLFIICCIFIYNHGELHKMLKNVKCSLIFVSGKNAILSTDRRASLTMKGHAS